MLWLAIGLAGALLLLVLLGKFGGIPFAVVQACGTILIYLAAAIMLVAVVYALKYAVKD